MKDLFDMVIKNYIILYYAVCVKLSYVNLKNDKYIFFKCSYIHTRANNINYNH